MQDRQGAKDCNTTGRGQPAPLKAENSTIAKEGYTPPLQTRDIKKNRNLIPTEGSGPPNRAAQPTKSRKTAERGAEEENRSPTNHSPLRQDEASLKHSSMHTRQHTPCPTPQWGTTTHRLHRQRTIRQLVGSPEGLPQHRATDQR